MKMDRTMAVYLKRVYHKEEAFLDSWSAVAEAVSRLLGGDWKPNYWCNDKARLNTKHSLLRGELQTLTFDSASVYQDKNEFSFTEIVLQCSSRVITVHVRKTNGNLIAEKIAEQKTLPIG
jgi:hypothetical protein